MKKLHTFAFYALVTSALTLGAGPVLAHYSGDMDNGSLQQGSQVSQGANKNTGYDRQKNQNDKSHSQYQSYLDAVPHNGIHASSLIGTKVHTIDDEDIGSVDDLILDENGQVVAILVSVGGFLGMGQKDVAIGWNNLTRSGTGDDLQLRVDVTRETLKAAPKYVEREQSRTARNTKRDHETQQHAKQSEQKSDSHAQNNRRHKGDHSGMLNRGHLASTPFNGSQANNLIGMDVHTNDNEGIGSVNDLVIDENGQVIAIVVSVGGFLGVGQKDVAIGWGNVTRSGTAEDEELRANVTRDALRSAPEFAIRN